MNLTAGHEVEVRIPGSNKEPSKAAISLLKELATRYPVLQKEIQKHLYDHYEPYAEAVESGEEAGPEGGPLPKITSPSDVWASARPVRVIVEATVPQGRLEIAFAVAWDEEHTVGATIEDWRVTDFSGSVGP